MNWVAVIIIIGALAVICGFLGIACVIAGARSERTFEAARKAEMDRVVREDR
jgi:hypothetical protein